VTFISNNMAIGAGITECTKQRFVTAMGEDPDACVGKIERLDFGTFTMHDMDVGISKNLPGNPLLGMNVLKQLKMVQSGDTLILENNP
jgi:predicted aspartyl protease